MRKRSATSAHRSPEQRLMQRRYYPDRRSTLRCRSTLRWDPNGERRYNTGRRKQDDRDAMKAALMSLWGRKMLLGRT